MILMVTLGPKYYALVALCFAANVFVCYRHKKLTETSGKHPGCGPVSVCCCLCCTPLCGGPCTICCPIDAKEGDGPKANDGDDDGDDGGCPDTPRQQDMYR